jgi:hypothetical protein
MLGRLGGGRSSAGRRKELEGGRFGLGEVGLCPFYIETLESDGEGCILGCGY